MYPFLSKHLTFQNESPKNNSFSSQPILYRRYSSVRRSSNNITRDASQALRYSDNSSGNYSDESSQTSEEHKHDNSLHEIILWSLQFLKKTPQKTVQSHYSSDSYSLDVSEDSQACIAKYNYYARGVDIMDQYITYYMFPHKSMKWYFRIVMFLLEITLLNSWILFTDT